MVDTHSQLIEEELATLERLLEERRYAEAFLVSWAIVEFGVDSSVSYLFGLAPSEDEAEIFNEISFARKLAYLKKRGVITTKEFKVFDGLRIRRNDIVHRATLEEEGFTGSYQLLAEDSIKTANMANAVADRIMLKNPELVKHIHEYYDTGV